MTNLYAGFRHLMVAFLIVMGWAGLTSVKAQAQSRKVVVVGVLGKATASFADQGEMEIRGGMSLPAGSTVKTGAKSAVDLDLGSVAGVIRLTENTTLVLEKFVNTEPAALAALSIELRLLQGTLLGNSSKVPATANFEVKISNGLVGIDHGQYRISAEGYVVLIQGTVVVAYVVDGKEPEPYTLKAPPPVYFSPVNQIQPAPEPLVKEVARQTRSKLPKR